MEEITNFMLAPTLDAERQATAAEVTEIFTKVFGKPDAAEAVLENLILDCGVNDSTFWRAITTALAQIKE